MSNKILNKSICNLPVNVILAMYHASSAALETSDEIAPRSCRFDHEDRFSLVVSMRIAEHVLVRRRAELIARGVDKGTLYALPEQVGQSDQRRNIFVGGNAKSYRLLEHLADEDITLELNKSYEDSFDRFISERHDDATMGMAARPSDLISYVIADAIAHKLGLSATGGLDGICLMLSMRHLKLWMANAVDEQGMARQRAARFITTVEAYQQEIMPALKSLEADYFGE